MIKSSSFITRIIFFFCYRSCRL